MSLSAAILNLLVAPAADSPAAAASTSVVAAAPASTTSNPAVQTSTYSAASPDTSSMGAVTPRKRAGRTSNVWQFASLRLMSADMHGKQGMATCNKCGKSMLYRSNSGTSNIRRHLEQCFGEALQTANGGSVSTIVRNNSSQVNHSGDDEDTCMGTGSDTGDISSGGNDNDDQPLVTLDMQAMANNSNGNDNGNNSRNNNGEAISTVLDDVALATEQAHHQSYPNAHAYTSSEDFLLPHVPQSHSYDHAHHNRCSLKILTTNFHHSQPHTVIREAACVKLVDYVIMEDLPFQVVERAAFLDLLLALRPGFREITAVQLQEECMAIYEQRQALMCMYLATHASTISATAEVCFSKRHQLYICLTLHFISKDWKPLSLIVAYRQLQHPPSSQNIANIIYASFLKWSLKDKLTTITMDARFSVDASLPLIIDLLRSRDPTRTNIISSVTIGKNDENRNSCQSTSVHIRCVWHVLNVLVNTGLDTFRDTLMRLRNLLRAIRESSTRLRTYNEIILRFQVSGVQWPFELPLSDIDNRWNTTAMMINRALEVQVVLKEISECDTSLPAECALVSTNWDMLKIAQILLDPFIKATKVLARSTYYPTLNQLVPTILRVKYALMRGINDLNPIIRQASSAMLVEFSNHWDIPPKIAFVAMYLDPNYKKDWLQFFLKNKIMMSDADLNHQTHYVIACVETALQALCNGQIDDDLSIRTPQSATTALMSTPTSTSSSLFHLNLLDDNDASDAEEFMRHMHAQSLHQPVVDCWKTEMEQYQTQGACLTKEDPLCWWKSHEKQFPLLARLARRYLNIPVAGVSSDTILGNIDRTLSDHRAALPVDTLEMCMTMSSWLENSNKIGDEIRIG